MSKFNASTVITAVRGVIQSEQTPSARTFQGAPGYARDPRSELFLLAVTNMVGEHTFYENAGARDDRFTRLVHLIAHQDPEWLIGFGTWLRGSANMRSASLVLAAEAVKSGATYEVPAMRPETARLDGVKIRVLAEDGTPNLVPVYDADGKPVMVEAGFRGLVDAVCQRADEPGEMIGYWLSHHGKAIPKPIKRGVADAAQRLYTERNVLKYDTASHAVRFADVIRLCHVDPKAEWQKTLFHYLIGKRINAEGLDVIPAVLPMLRANQEMRALTPVEASSALTEGRWSSTPSDLLAAAGMNWENVPSLVNGPWTASLWEAMIPNMGYMALLRNLRNFDQAGVTDRVAKKVADTIADPEAVAKSRQLPMRFLSAYNAAPSLRWAYALEQALDACVSNIPVLRGRTLVLVDTSSSMHSTFSKDGTLHRWDAAAMFGLALARRCEDADVVSFASSYYGGTGFMTFPQIGAESLLRSLERWKRGGYFIGGGTDTVRALSANYAKHDRVVILTDEQASHTAYGQSVDGVLPASTVLHTMNLAGYQRGHAPDKVNRYTYGGLTDAMFAMMSRVESGANGVWPWLAE